MYIVKGGGLRIESDARHASVSAETVLGYVEVPALLRATTLAEAARRRASQMPPQSSQLP